MFLIEDDGEQKNTQTLKNSLEDMLLNILTSVGFIIALVLIAVNVNAGIIADNINFKKNDVSMKVSEMIIKTELIQGFKNKSKKLLEGIHLFSVPDSAVDKHVNLYNRELKNIKTRVKYHRKKKSLAIFRGLKTGTSVNSFRGAGSIIQIIKEQIFLIIGFLLLLLGTVFAVKQLSLLKKNTRTIL